MKRILLFIACLLIIGCENQFDDSENTDPEYVFDAFWTELDRNYSFFNYVDFNWDSVYSSQKVQVNSTTTNNQLFMMFHNILSLLNDAHTNIYSPIGIGGNISYFANFKVNKLDDISSYFSYYNTINGIFDFGELKDYNLGYIRISTFGEDEGYHKFDSIVQLFQDKDGLIIDVRSNWGGYISNVQEVISCLADSSRIACKYHYRNGLLHDDFSDWENFTISPDKEGGRFTKPIAVLTNRQSYSATEWFVLSATTLPNVVIVGDTTGGGSAITLTRELPNGWFLRVSNSQTLLPEGRDYQFTGLYPDYPVWISRSDAAGHKDTILEKAISLLCCN